MSLWAARRIVESQQDFAFPRYTNSSSNNQNTGINFLWRNNSGTVEMVGVKPDDGDINISLGKPKC